MNKEEIIEQLKKEQVDTMAHKIDKIYEAIFGNGKPGIVTEVSNLKIVQKILCWCLGVAYTAGVTWIICAVMDIIKK